MSLMADQMNWAAQRVDDRELPLRANSKEPRRSWTVALKWGKSSGILVCALCVTRRGLRRENYWSETKQVNCLESEEALEVIAAKRGQ